ncbi:hypothetical protein [Streptomyces sp. NPDC088925]|uniref:hypothetical protein n=1 Tax=Streptomyces sp. NPDC088925 TaxID=3365914 RepID=UPI00381BA448
MTRLGTVPPLALQLPAPDTIRARCIALAMLDAILIPSPLAERPHEYRTRWMRGASLARWHDGLGNHRHIAFSPAGVIAVAHSADAPTPTRPGPVDQAPYSLQALITASVRIPADEHTFCAWRTSGATAWSTAGEADSADVRYLFESVLDTGTYRTDTENYLDRTLSPQAIEAVLSLRPLTGDTISALNPTVEIASVLADMDTIGYPR